MIYGLSRESVGDRRRQEGRGKGRGRTGSLGNLSSGYDGGDNRFVQRVCRRTIEARGGKIKGRALAQLSNCQTRSVTQRKEVRRQRESEERA